MTHRNILFIALLVSVTLFLEKQSYAEVPEYYELLGSKAIHVVGIISYKAMNLSELKKSSRHHKLLGPQSPIEDNNKYIIDPRNNNIQRVARGVGFFVTSDGHIVTHDTLVKGADQVEVTLNDGTILPASIVDIDSLNGIGVLKISGGVFAAAPIGKSDNARIGDWALAIGTYPARDHAVIGTLTTKGNDHPSIPIGAYLQFSGLLSQQNIGSPLFNRDGDVIGMIIPQDQYYQFQDKNSLAKPIEVVMNVANQIITHGRTNRMMLGISVIDFDSRKINLHKPGVRMLPMIAEVQANGLGNKSGLLIGDIIIDFNGIEITSPMRLIQLLSLTKPDEHVVMTALRNGRIITIPINPD